MLYIKISIWELCICSELLEIERKIKLLNFFLRGF